MKGAVGQFTVPMMYRHVVSAELVPEAEDAMRAGFGGVKIVLGSLEWCEVFDGEVFWKLFNREAGKIVGHLIGSWGFAQRVFICVWDGAD